MFAINTEPRSINFRNYKRIWQLLNTDMHAIQDGTETMVRAVAVLRGEPGVQGTVFFTQESESAPTQIEVSLKGLKPGKHGFHIHEFGDNTNVATELTKGMYLCRRTL